MNKKAIHKKSNCKDARRLAYSFAVAPISD